MVFIGEHWPSIALQLPDLSVLPGPLNLFQRKFLPARGYNLIILGEDSDSFTEIFKMSKSNGDITDGGNAT